MVTTRKADVSQQVEIDVYKNGKVIALALVDFTSRIHITFHAEDDITPSSEDWEAVSVDIDTVSFFSDKGIQYGTLENGMAEKILDDNVLNDLKDQISQAVEESDWDLDYIPELERWRDE